MISDKTVDILVQSRDASYRAAFTAAVTHSITDYQPHFNINATSWRIPKKISLADPHFDQSQRIDLLLGVVFRNNFYRTNGSLPIRAKIVRRDFYVDDLISGGDSVEEVREIRRQVKELL